MLCSSCGFMNPEGMNFCGKCATLLAPRCPQCGLANPPGFAFCGKCATPLSQGETAKRGNGEKAEEARPRTPNSEPIAAERRQLTVMFCDLVGSTALSEQLDPEEYREVIQAYNTVCATVIQRFDGHLAKYLGDGLLVYFGYPVAHEDDAQRAVRAGLEIITAIEKQVPSPLAGEPVLKERILQVRIGIHTGVVVAGEMGAGETRETLAIVGETPNLAARLQGLAEPNTVVISAATQRLVHGFFMLQDRGSHAVKGLSTPVEVYAVQGESHIQSRFDLAVTTGLTPLVGREEELGLLEKRWQRAKEGDGQVVLLRGEAGIGKSRLARAVREQAATDQHAWLTIHCSPYHQNSAFYPLIEVIPRALSLRPEDSPQEKLSKLSAALERVGMNLEEHVPLVTSFLALPTGEFSLPSLTPQKLREKTLRTLVSLVVQETKLRPVLLLWEDLHWADPSSLEFIHLLIDQAPTARLLMLLTCRPEFIPTWALRSHVTQLTLNRLGRTHVEAMIEKVSAVQVLSPETIQQIVTKADGVPLFVEELTKTVLESGSLGVRESRGALTQSPLQLGIPVTLHDALMARLDRLGEAKEVAQLGATLGREFSYELLQAVSSADESALQHALGKLVDSELLYQRGLLPQAQYVFKHALIQDTAYQSLLKSTRQKYHSQIAQILEERFAELKANQPELLAHHYTEAGLIAQAIPYWQQAGQKAVQRSANVEAVAHLTKGLELLKTRPDTPERVQQELTLQLALNGALIFVKGFTAPEVEKTVARARELCQQLGETPQLFLVLSRLYMFYQNRGELQTTRELAEQMMRLAQRVQDRDLLSWAHTALGGTLYWLGELTSARQHQEQAIALYDPQQHPRYTAGVAEPRAPCFYYASLTLWHLGYPGQALKRSQEAVAVAAGLSRPFNLAQALGFAAGFHFFRREWQLARERAEAVMTLSTEQGFPFWLAHGTIVRGGALAEQGQVEEGVAQMQHGLAAFRAMGAELVRIDHLPRLAAVYAKTGQIKEGLSVLTEALAFVDRTGMRFCEAEIYRIKGELTLQSSVQSLESRVKTAEECFLHAIEIAKRQQAKSWELRAATSLARLWQQQSKRTEAHRLLSDVYNWFTEGFDTKDLQEAKALLEDLGGNGEMGKRMKAR